MIDLNVGFQKWLSIWYYGIVSSDLLPQIGHGIGQANPLQLRK
jgi:hypothetical protein